MTLQEWCEQNGGASAKRLLQDRTSLRWQTIHFIVEGKVMPKPSTARLLEYATDGQVSAASLLGLEPAAEKAS